MEPTRLDKALSALLGIPRGEARRYIEGGWVTVKDAVKKPVPDNVVTPAAVRAAAPAEKEGME